MAAASPSAIRALAASYGHRPPARDATPLRVVEWPVRQPRKPVPPGLALPPRRPAARGLRTPGQAPEVRPPPAWLARVPRARSTIRCSWAAVARERASWRTVAARRDEPSTRLHQASPVRVAAGRGPEPD